MKIREAWELLQPRGPQLRGIRKIERCHTIGDIHRMAVGALPRPVSDYIDGGSDDEVTLERNTHAFSNWSFLPRLLRDVTSVDTSTHVLGRPQALPLGLAPTGYTRMISPAGEPAVARAAAAAGVPYVLSTMASTSMEALQADEPNGREERWFQLYPCRERSQTLDLIHRARAAGYRVLEVAVDTAVSGCRVRDLHNGLTIPPSLGPRALADIARRPRYWAAMLTSPAIEFANLRSASEAGATIQSITDTFDPAFGWDDLEWVRAQWSGPLLVKGPVSPKDARRAQQCGVDGIHLSNHGGRQLDRAVVTAELIAPVRRATGDDFTIVVDSGVRHGSDIATAIALGADATFIGRPYLWGLAADGAKGVNRVLSIFTAQFTRTLQLLGVSSVPQLRDQGESLLQPR